MSKKIESDFNWTPPVDYCVVKEPDIDGQKELDYLQSHKIQP